MALLTRFWSLDLLVLFLSLFFAFYLYMTRNFNYWKKRGVVEVPPLPFIGSFKDVILLQKSPAQIFNEWYVKYPSEPCIGFYVLDRPLLMIRDPELVKNIVVKDFHHFQNKNMAGNMKDSLTIANLFIAKNPIWRYLRKKMTPVYTISKLRKLFELMLDVCKDLETYLESCHLEGKGKVMEVKDLSAIFTTDLIATTAYGIKANSLNNPDAEFRKNGRAIFHFTIQRSYEFLTVFFAPQLVTFLDIQFFGKNSSAFLKNAVKNILEQREKTGEKRGDVIDLLLEFKQSQQTEEEKNIIKLEGDNLVAQAAVFFTGGFETSSTLMSFALYELAQNLDVQDKLRNELREAMDRCNGKMTYDILTSLPYMEAVVTETLRLYPPLPHIDRTVTETYQIPGTDVILEEGIPIFIPILSLHMDEEFYPNPKRFNPENFSEENKKARKSCTYIPFGEGPRACIGRRIGLVQAMLGITTILLHYEVTTCEQTEIPMKQNPRSILTATKDGVFINIRKLQS